MPQTALVKSRPGRQEWENAPPFFRCTAAPPEAVLRARGESFAVRYSTASQLKEQGNDVISKVRMSSRRTGQDTGIAEPQEGLILRLWVFVTLKGR